MTETPTLPPEFKLGLPLPHTRRASGFGTSFLVHVVVVAGLLWAGARLGSSGSGIAGGGQGGRASVNFFALPSGAPSAIEVPSMPRVDLAHMPPLSQIKVDLPRVDIPRETASPAPDQGVAGGGGGGGGQGGGAGGGTGATLGPGTGGEGDYILPASPRTAILPPAKVPGSVAGRTYRIRFSVTADGRVTRVEIDPPIADEAYRREFLERLLAFQFVPARTRDGRNVASVVTVTVRPGH